MMVKRRSVKSLIDNQSGATIVEAAVILPLYFMLVFGILGWGLVLWQVNAMQYAAERSARCSILPQNVQGNRQCGDWSDTTANLIDWIPMISSTSISPNASSGTLPTAARTFQSTRTGTAESYNVNCITISIANPFFTGLANLPNVLRQSYCRPAQN